MENIIFSYIDKIIQQGFMGVYLNKIDEFGYGSDPDNGEDEYLSEEESAKRMIDFIIEIAEYSRDKVEGDFYIIPQNGEKILKYDKEGLIDIVSGWAAEDLFYNGTQEWGQEEIEQISQERFPYLDKIIAKGKLVFSVDYDDYRQKAINKGYIPYTAISDRNLDELNIINTIQPINLFSNLMYQGIKCRYKEKG